jgi:hypothetical protein
MGFRGVIDRTEAPRSFAAITPLAVAPSSFIVKFTAPRNGSRALAALALGGFSALMMDIGVCDCP